MAFARPDIGFRLFIDDKLRFSCAANAENSLLRAHILLGDDPGYLYEVRKETGLLTMHGVVGAPMVQRRDTRGMVFFVNDRLVSDKKLIIAVKTAFRSLIEVGFHPVCALKIAIAPDEVDVNVHPRKAEVRFRNDQGVVSQIISELSSFLAKTPWLSTNKEITASSGTERPLAWQNISRGPRVRFDYLLDREHITHQSTNFEKLQEFSMALPIVVEKNPLLQAHGFSSLRVIGQVCSTYLLAESEHGLVIVDQHAAHERVIYEKIRRQRTENPPILLLLPITFDLDLSSMALFEENGAQVKSLGIDAEKFGENTIIVRGLPGYIKNADVKALMLAILSDLGSYGRSVTAEEMLHHLFATLACHSAIRAGQRLNKEEIDALFVDLDGIDFGAHCPHGRPIVKSFSSNDMKKWFDRT